MCSVKDNSYIIVIYLSLDGLAGPKAALNASERTTFSYPYFIAATSSQGNIVAKQLSSVNLAYENKTDYVRSTETIRQIVPMTLEEGQGTVNEILVGFQLADYQLEYNKVSMAVDPQK